MEGGGCQGCFGADEREKKVVVVAVVAAVVEMGWRIGVCDGGGDGGGGG